MGGRRGTLPGCKRASVERDVTEFVGFEKLIELVGQLDKSNRALFAGAFLTGGRISEVLKLRRENFIMMEKLIRVRKMPLLKQYSKTERWIEQVSERPANVLRRLYTFDPATQMWWRRRFKTERREEFRREFAFPADEPLATILIQHLSKIESGLMFDATRQGAWRALRKIGIYPHWLRAQRASCLIAFWGFSMEQMMEWMGWKGLVSAMRYGRMGWRRLADMFQGVQIPSHIREMERNLEVK
jgi:integrase